MLAYESRANDDIAINDANNPLNPVITFNLQNYYIPRLTGLHGRETNQFLIRGLIPHRFYGVPQMFRFTMPIATVPEFPSGYETGLGDLTLMKIFLFPGKVTFGAGPILVAPTATDNSLGSGKWQAGLIGAVVAPQKWGLVGGLITWQSSFAGKSDRKDVSLLTVQPIINFNLSKGFYIRSSATWNFDLEHDNHFIPIGLGIGRVIKLKNGSTLNVFIEPQYTIHDRGIGNPKWQIFAGLNFQFDVGR